MKSLSAIVLSSLLAVALVAQAPAQAEASGTKKFVAGLVVGAAAVAAAAVLASDYDRKGSRYGKRHVKVYSGDCGPGYSWKGGRCVSKYQGASRPGWQVAAMRKGCKPGQGWNKQEGCHEND
ncbi:MAG: hypothetical protein NW205_11575 [Hyphomicrobiaceae bacterium]|nr:hypothetical protein [Hyphomicrobiaceae bacterium]